MSGLDDSLLGSLADAITRQGGPSGPDTRPSDGAVMRFGTVLTVAGSKVTTDATGAALVTVVSDYAPAVGNVVVLLTQGPVAVVVSGIGGRPSAPPVGVIHPYAGTSAPSGWVLANGQVLSRTAYPDLFAVCGTAYGGGDGPTTFNVPNLTDRMPVASGSMFARGEAGGQEFMTLTTAQLPTHSHTVNNHTHSVTGTGGVTVQSGTGATVSNATAGQSGGSTPTTNNAGSGSAFNNMPPYLTVGGFIVRALP